MPEQEQNSGEPAKKQNRGMFDGQRVVILEEDDYQTLLKMAGVRDANWSVGRWIARKRWNMGVSQAELARRAGLRPETINRIEKGRTEPTLPTLAKIEQVLRELDNAHATRVRLSASMRESKFHEALHGGSQTPSAG
jgi:DNA-binding XRE family transcriptional regulator